VLFFLFSLAFSQEDCTEKISNVELQHRLDSVELGFVTNNLEKITEEMGAINHSIACLEERISVEIAARYHINKGLLLWLQNQEAEMTASFSVAKRIDEKAHISSHVFPPEHGIHEIYMKVEPAIFMAVEKKPLSGAYSFDGFVIQQRPKNTPSIVQIIDKEDVRLSTYLSSKTPLPNGPKPSKKYGKIALAASGVSLLAGTVFLIDSQLQREHYRNMQEGLLNVAKLEDIHEFEEIYKQHKASYVTSISLYAVSAGLCGLSFALEW